jgi:4-amino-4-deoxy-L-arabinose transferase-like glycosyltransferase
MTRRVLSRGEGVIWTACFLAASALIVATRFTSEDADSSLYASIAARLSLEPVSRWIAPEWWGFWARVGSTGLYRDHPVGGFLLPAALARLGIPGEQAAYVVGTGMALVALILIGGLVRRVTSRDEARAAIVLLQFMPVAFIFRIRANQEYALLVCTLVTILGLDRVRRSWSGLVAVLTGIVAALLIKGLFVVFPLMAAAIWILANPTRAEGPNVRPVAALALAVAAMALTATGYDALYRHATGESFWVPYWQTQLSPVTVATPMDEPTTLIGHVGFYLVRLLWHPAPWSLAVLALAWNPVARWRAADDGSRRAIGFTLALAAACVVLLSPSSRVAERYVFQASYAVAATGAVIAWRSWGSLRRALATLDARVPALPALVWLALTGVRVGLGAGLPRF